MLRITERGLYCAAADIYIDPWLPVERAVITHAHGDHARWGSRHYLASREGARVLRTRLGPDASIELLDYGESHDINGVSLTLVPAGHILGSAQVRLEHRGEVWVVSGDYKTEPDPTCSPFEPVRCHTFITESTFGLPIYRWCAQEETFAGMRAWWRENAERGQASLVYAYALGKAQRVLAGMLGADIGPVYTHGAVERLTADYRATGVELHATTPVASLPKGTSYAGSLIIAPPSAAGSLWLRRFGDTSTAFASGWMQVRGARRRRSLDRGFVLSDHVDWPALIATIEATGAEHVWVTHGYRDQVVRYLVERGVDAQAVASHWEGENDQEPAVAGEEAMA
ncbi:MAG: ligase-associated DNA damage response exonuclease [bacterium]